MQHQPGRSCEDPWVGPRRGDTHRQQMSGVTTPRWLCRAALQWGQPLTPTTHPALHPRVLAQPSAHRTPVPQIPWDRDFAAPSLSHSEDQNPPGLCDLCRGGCTPRAGPGQHSTALSRLSPPSPAAKHPSSFQPVSFPATAASSVPVPAPGTEGFTVPCRAASGDIWGLGNGHGLPKGVTVTDC